MSVIELSGGARVQSDACASLVLRDPAGLEEVEVIFVNPHPELDRHRNLRRRCYRGSDNRFEQSRFGRNGRTAPFAGHLADRAAEIEVEVVHTAFTDKTAHRFADILRVDAVDLEAPWPFVGPEIGQLEGFLAALDQGAGGDHLADIEPRAKTAAQGPEGIVCDPGHRRQDNRWRDLNRPDADALRNCHRSLKRKTPR